MAIKPNGKKTKVLPIFFLVDLSESMRHDRIGAVNVAMRDVVAELKNKLAPDNLDVTYVVRVLTFGRYGADYKYGSKSEGIPLADYEWTEITDDECEGYTPMGECIEKVYEVFQDGVYPEYLGARIATPFVLLISDGQPNGEVDVKEISEKLFKTKAGNKSICVSIGISVDDNEVAKDVLKTFGKSGFVSADGSRPEELANLISKVTIASLTTASSTGEGSKDEENKKKIDEIVNVSDIL